MLNSGTRQVNPVFKLVLKVIDMISRTTNEVLHGDAERPAGRHDG